jgi:hypothetical protein
MAFTYCQHCGTKHEYSSSIPNFCTNCGTSFGAARAPSGNLKNEEEEITKKPSSIPEINKLDYEIKHNDYQESTIGSVMKEEKLNISTPRRSRKSLTGDSVKDCIEECKPAREAKEIDG